MIRYLVLLICVVVPVFGYSEEVELQADSAGNGGHLIVCGEGQETTYEVLDYHEARRSGVVYELGPRNLSVIEKVEIVAARWEAFDQDKARFLREMAVMFLRNMILTSDVPLVNDRGISDVDRGCDIKQLAVQYPPRFPGDITFLVEKDLWRKIDNDQKAVLVIHEMVYWMAILANQSRSNGARKLVTLLASNQISDMTTEEYLEFLKLTGQPVYYPLFGADGISTRYARKLSLANDRVFWTSDRKVFSFGLEESFPIKFPETHVDDARSSLTINHVALGDYVYWTDYEPGSFSLLRAKVDGGDEEVIGPIHSRNGALFESDAKLYWWDGAESTKTLYAFDPETGSVEALFENDFGSGAYLRGVYNGRAYWTSGTKFMLVSDITTGDTVKSIFFPHFRYVSDFRFDGVFVYWRYQQMYMDPSGYQRHHNWYYRMNLSTWHIEKILFLNTYSRKYGVFGIRDDVFYYANIEDSFMVLRSHNLATDEKKLLSLGGFSSSGYGLINPNAQLQISDDYVIWAGGRSGAAKVAKKFLHVE